MDEHYDCIYHVGYIHCLSGFIWSQRYKYGKPDEGNKHPKSTGYVNQISYYTFEPASDFSDNVLIPCYDTDIVLYNESMAGII